MQKPNFYDLTMTQLQEYLQANSYSRYVAGQIFSWVYKKGEYDLDKWSNVKKELRAHLIKEFCFDLPQVCDHQFSKDGTKKFLLRLYDGHTVEAVMIPSGNSRVSKINYSADSDESLPKITLCISTQVGCAMKCAFCYSGTQGLTRNLSCAEIVGQYLSIRQFMNNPNITNIVYMGQGEPLHNFEEVKSATLNLMDESGLGFGQRKITLSTSGLVPKLLQLTNFPPINLAISLHSPRNEIRDQLMPINRTYNLEQLFAAIKKIPLKSHRRITYEYLLIDGLTNTSADIIGLSRLLERSRSKINLIPFNEYPGSRFKRPSDENVLWFCNELGELGYTCTIRHSKGTDILAACGQLKSKDDEEKVRRQNVGK